MGSANCSLGGHEARIDAFSPRGKAGRAAELFPASHPLRCFYLQGQYRP